MHLLHSSIEQFFIVQMQHALMLSSKRGSLSLAVIIQAALSSSLGSVCTSGDTYFLPVSSLKKSEAFASLETEGPLLLPGLDVITAAPLPPIGAAVFYGLSATEPTIWSSA